MITAVEYQAAWEPGAPVAPVEWDRKRFVTEEGEDDALAEALNSDPRVRRTVRKLLSPLGSEPCINAVRRSQPTPPPNRHGFTAP